MRANENTFADYRRQDAVMDDRSADKLCWAASLAEGIFQFLAPSRDDNTRTRVNLRELSSSLRWACGEV